MTFQEQSSFVVLYVATDTSIIETLPDSQYQLTALNFPLTVGNFALCDFEASSDLLVSSISHKW